MSKILKGLNESTHNKYDNNRTGFSRGPRDDERHDLDAQKPTKEEWALKINGKVWSKDGKTVTFTSKEKALKARQSLLTKRPELEVGLVTRSVAEGMMPIGGNSTSTDRRKVMDLLQVYYKSMGGDFWEWFNQPGNKEFFAKRAEVSPDSAYEVVDSIDWGQHPQEEWPEDDEEQLNELSNKKLGKYKTAAGKDASKADSEGDYKRGDKRYKGITTATKKEFANDTKTVKEDINVVYKKAKSLLTQLDENTQQRVINALKKSVVKEFEGDVQAIDAPTTNKPPRQTFSIVLQGKPPKDFEARFVWAALQNVFPNDYPVGTDNAEWKVVEVSKKGSAIIKSGINNRDIAETLVAKLVKNKVPAPCLKIISSELDEADEKPAEPFKTGYPRVNNPKILGTQNRAKSIYHPPSKPNVKKLDKPLPENLGNELKSKSLEALQQVKQKLEQQRMADLEQWEKDFKQNTVSKFTAREPNLRQRATSTPMVAMPGEKHSELKTRLGQLDKAIEKQGILDNLVQRLDKKGLLTPNIEAGVDTSMLARDGARDNYVELNRKLDKALEYVKNRLLTNKAAYAKPKGVDEGWSQKYKSSINCSHPKGFSQKAHCAGKKKHNESIEMEMVCEDCGMCETHVDHTNLDEACWKGYHKEGNKKMFGKTYPNCVKNTNEELDNEEGRENYNGLNILLQKDDEELFVKASAGGRELGHVLFVIDNGYLMPQDLEVEERFRGQGIAQTMYDYVKSKGYKIRRSGQQTDAGAGFWDKHRPEQNVWEEHHSETCPHCGGEMVSEELMNEKKDACYYKVKSRYKVWPSAYASGALVKCRKKGADSWGNGGKKNESSILEGIEQADESLHDWFNKEKWVRMDTKGKIKGPCAREPGEGKPKCLPQSKAHSLGKKGRASAAQRKRREDPNPERSGKAINVNTKKSKG